MADKTYKNVVLKDPKTGVILYPEVNVEIPTVNDKTVTIKKNGTAVDSFTLNQATDKDINITVPTKTSDLTNDSEFLVEGDLADYAKKTDIPTVNDKTITISKNGTAVDSFTLNQSSNKTISITVPTTAADVSALPASTKYAASAVLSIDTDTYVMSLQLKDQDGNNLGTAQTLDLPLETMVVSGSYNTTTKKIVLTLQGGSTVEFSVADLISGLQTEITSTNKLSADLVANGTTNKVVTATEKAAWNNKQDSINDLSDIRVNAQAGADAASTISSYGDIVSHDADEFASADHTHTPASIGAAAESHGHTKADITDFPAIPTVNNTEIEIQKNSTKVDSFTTNQSGSKKTINITVPTTASDVGAAEANHTHTKSQITDFPAIPTVTDTYSATSSSGMSGKAVASAISGITPASIGAAEATHTHDEYLTNVAWDDVDNKPSTFTPSAHNQASDTINALTGYSKTVSGGTGALATSDTLNKALAKIENALDGKQASGSYVPTSRTVNGKALSANISLSASDVGALPDDTVIPTKTSELTNDAGFLSEVAWDDVADKPSSFTPASHNQASNTINALTGYSKTVSGGTGALATSDTLNKALAKIENALDGKQVSGSYASATHTHTKDEITDFPTIPTVNNNTITINKNGTKVDSFTLNQSSNKTINITVPTSAADVSALPASTKYASSISLSVDTDTYVISAQLKDQDGNNLGTAGTIDLPLESVVVSGSYNTTTKKVVLTLKDGSTIEFSIADLVSGLQTEITSTNKLSADLIKDGTTNKVVTATEKNTWNNKQAAISDINTIRTNAQSGAEAATTIAGYGDIVSHDAEDFASADHTHSGYVPTSRTVNGKALSANISLTASDVGALSSDTVIPTKVSELTNDSGFVSTDTKNTAGTTNKTGTKMFLAAATSQGANPQTYSNSNCYIGTDNCLYSGGVKVLTSHQSLSGYVPTTRTVNGKALSANITLSASDVGALPEDTVIPDAVTETTVSGWGFTKNAGTVTGITMNGSSKGTSGVVDLGTVLTSHQTVKVNGVTGATTNNFGTCSTAAATAAKTVALTAGTFTLEAGARVLVKFTVTNTAANPTLNVGGTGAKAIQYRGAAITAGYLAANRTYAFVYDGTNYQLVGDINTDTNNATAQNISTADDTYPILLGNTANATANIGNKATLFGSGIKANPSTSTIVATTFDGNATSATTASKLGTVDKGSATQPIYLEDGVPTACTYTLAKSVPSDAKFTDTVYTHPTTSGNKHIPSGGSSGQFLKWSADGTATWAADNNTLNTAGTSNKTGTKMFLAGATSQAANPQTYSNSNVFIDAANTLNCVTPATTLDGDTAANKTKVATVGTVSAMIDALCTQLDAQTTNWS